MKYNIENNIDFYNELYGTLCDDENTETSSCNENNIELCLISNLPLVNNFVKLNCGHKFNYGPLYKDIFNHKKKFNNMEQIKTKLKQNQIRCPYCRNVQDELLPYYENFGFPKEHGVNFFDVNKGNYDNTSFGIAGHQCQYQIINFDSSGNAHTHQCNHYGYVHMLLKNKYNDDTKYCYPHKLLVVKQLKETINNEKKAKKLDEQNKKLEAKNKMKMELLQKKMEEKANKKPNDTANANANPNDIINIGTNQNNFCKAILKSGKFKGTHCFANIYKDCLCKRHYNLENKDNITSNNLILDENDENEENIVIDKDIKI